MADWLEKLESGGVVVLDGGTGTELRRRGAPWGDPSWSALAGDARRDLLVSVHRDYIDAGAEVVTANTFGGARFVLEAAGCADRFERVNRGALDAALEAREKSRADVAIAASMSCLPPRFDARGYPPAAVEQADYRELAELFAAAGADLIALEMMQDDRHAVWACEAAQATGLPCWIGISARLGPAGAAVAYDYPETPIERVLDALLPFSPAVVTVMHTPPEAVDAALDAVRSRWRGFVGVYPELAPAHGDAQPLSPAALAGLGQAWIARGVRIVGGCCGTGPEHVRALADSVP